ncbi:MAG: hypothetical protein ACOYOK_04620 [Pseudobdellovibrionaceae bacterium]
MHFELQGAEAWIYDIKKSSLNGENVVVMTIDSVDESLVKILKNFKSDLIKKIEIDKNAKDKKNELKFYLSQNKVEVFDYLTDQPSRLVVDFYINPDVESIEKIKSTSTEKNNSIEKKDFKKSSDKKQKRNTASEYISLEKPIENEKNSPSVKAGIFDGNDPEYQRFSIEL